MSPQGTASPASGLPAAPRTYAGPADLGKDDLRVRAALTLFPGIDGSPMLDRLAELASQLVSAPSAQINLLTDRQDNVAVAGEDAGQRGAALPLEGSLCSVTAAAGETTLITDATADERVAELPPVRSGQVGSYLGVPLVTAAGDTVGVICVFGPAARTWTPAEVAVLEQLTPSVLAALDLAAAARDYADSRQRWEMVAQAADIGSFDYDLVSGDVDRDARMQELFSPEFGEIEPALESTLRQIHTEDRPAVEAAMAAALSSGGDYRTEFRVVLPEGAIRWVSARGRCLVGADGRPVRLIGAAYDVTEAHLARAAARQSEAEAGQRLALLAQVTDELSTTLDIEESVSTLARLVVPSLGDWCVVTLVEDAGFRDVGCWHVDAAMRPLVARYAATRMDAITPGSFLFQALETSQPVLVPADAEAAIREILTPGEASDVMTALHPESFSVLPLTARGRTVGLISLFRNAGRPPLAGADLAIALEVTGRAALALDNAQLYAQQRHIAEGLQRSMLTEPPEPDHCEIVVRYTPAAETASVGGDWFDAFLQPDGATVLVIGDVVGHDTEAAAAMGQLRGLLRGIAWQSGAGPARVLSRLDAAMEGLQIGTTATAIVARLEQTEEELERCVARLRWSNAGHPAPMAINPYGEVQPLTGLDADLLLGIDPRTDRAETVVTMDRGSTILMYTDGLVERRGQDIDDGLALLRDVLTELAHLPLQELCDRVLERMLPERAEDDVAMVAVRLHRQDRPRPPEAGPEDVPPGVPPDDTSALTG
ncbi:hypothetical protein acdb102_18940 [Acidothermaceae bacterium B102]|nr:hypothetical protein acdb102_18940 [Acidothermaceae bacterium B102]